MRLPLIYSFQLIISLNSADPFHVHNLRAYIKQFEFRTDPLDVALRKLADVVEVNSADIIRTSFFNIGGTGGSFNSVSNGAAAQANLSPSAPQPLALRVTKVGLLNRKDDVLAGGRKASNRHQELWRVPKAASPANKGLCRLHRFG